MNKFGQGPAGLRRSKPRSFWVEAALDEISALCGVFDTKRGRRMHPIRIFRANVDLFKADCSAPLRTVCL